MLPGGQSRRTSMYLGEHWTNSSIKPIRLTYSSGNGSEAPFAPGPRYSPIQSPSRHMSMTASSSYNHYGYNNGYPSGPGSAYGYGSRRTMGHRAQSAPFAQNRMSSDYSLYQGHDRYHESHDTVNTIGGSSGSQSEPWGNSTDPSSENSSIDRVQAGVDRMSLGASDRLQVIKQMEPDSNNPYGYGRGASPIHNAAVRDTAIREEEDGRSVRGNNYFMPVQQGPRRSSPPMMSQQQQSPYPQGLQRRPTDSEPTQNYPQPQAPTSKAPMNAAAAAWAASSRPMAPQPQSYAPASNASPYPPQQPNLPRAPSAAAQKPGIIKFDQNAAIANEYQAENVQKVVRPAASTKRKSWFGRKK